jgi:hypothetical protein
VASVALLFALESWGLSTRVISVQVHRPPAPRPGYNVDNLEPASVHDCRATFVGPPAPRIVKPAKPAAQAVATSCSPVAAAAPAKAAKIRGRKGGETGRIRGRPGPSACARTAGRAGATAAPYSIEEAWATELKVRPWRNMPLPLVNLANAALVLPS